MGHVRGTATEPLESTLTSHSSRRRVSRSASARTTARRLISIALDRDTTLAGGAARTFPSRAQRSDITHLTRKYPAARKASIPGSARIRRTVLPVEASHAIGPRFQL